ncbi:hypothetical protein NJB1907f44_03870 [Mycobacterium marinum]|nr:hypothetical protein NJB1907f34b_03080 [Mycobacterium marinum]GJO04069.1 hypothetical protein NJB1907E90_11750 [Mycobacterium marinum]GJO10080.1 hypothetical protein NJB1808e29_44950 [Mycobacterium marinum]GJO15924.1 hypothetical protein NJB1728e18_08980 [Mycobacterium marinum]GJO34753.1 hypothetical protein NJB1907E19_12970 [Mycobacterium marinum]
MASADIANSPPTACIGLEPRPNVMPGVQRSAALFAMGPRPFAEQTAKYAAYHVDMGDP